MIVYTSVFGHTKPLTEQVWPGRYVCFTDQDIASDTWEIIRLPEKADPALACREKKLMPHLLWPGETTLWIDSNAKLLRAPGAIAKMYPEEFTTFKHNARKDITLEAAAIIRYGKAQKRLLESQLKHYRHSGYSRGVERGLWGCGAILRRDTDTVRRHGERWFEECLNWTRRDQMSLGYAAWMTGLQISEFGGSVRRNGIVRFVYDHSNHSNARQASRDPSAAQIHGAANCPAG